MNNQVGNVSFGASFQKFANVERIFKNGNRSLQKVSIVELNPSDRFDLQAIKEVGDTWNTSISKHLAQCAENRYRPVGERYFAVTTQNNNYNKLNSDKILSINNFLDSPNSKTKVLPNMQVDPDKCQYGSFDRKFKGVGSVVLDYLKELSSDATIVLNSLREAIPFYKANKFIVEDVYEPTVLVWNRAIEASQ